MEDKTDFFVSELRQLMDGAMVNYMRKEYNLMIGDSTAEKIKKEIGTAIPTNNNTYAVKGRDLRSGTPKEVNITEEDTAEALNDILKQMVNGIKDLKQWELCLEVKDNVWQ